MSYQNPSTLFITSDRAAAEIIAQWARDQGVAVEIQSHMKESDGVGLTPYSDADQFAHWEIVLSDITQMERLKQQLVDQQDELLQHVEAIAKPVLEQVIVTCEACGKNTVYPGNMQGTVQECSHCGEYLDVPGGEDEYDWSIVDESVPEDAADNEEADDNTWG